MYINVSFQGEITPSARLSSDEMKVIEQLLKHWMSKLNFQNACLHFEAKCRPESIYNETVLFDEDFNLIKENNFLMPIEGKVFIYQINLL